MMRLLSFAALVAVAVAARRRRQQTFTDMVNPLIEGQDNNPPTGVFLKVASVPLARDQSGSISVDVEDITDLFQGPMTCPESMMTGAARITVQPSQSTCTITTQFQDKDSETGLVKDTLIGEYNFFAAACSWTRGDVTYMTSVDSVLQFDETSLQFTGQMSVSQGSIQNCVQQYLVRGGDADILSVEVVFQNIDPTFGEITVHQTSQGWYRLEGEMLVGTGGASFSYDEYDTSVKADLKKYVGTGLQCPNGFINFVLPIAPENVYEPVANQNYGPLTPLQFKEGYRGCASVLGLTGGQYGGLFNMNEDFAPDDMGRINLFGFEGAAPYRDVNGIKQWSRYAILLIQIDYDLDIWAVLTTVNPTVVYNGTAYNLLDQLSILDLEADLDLNNYDTSLVENNLLQTGVSINLYARVARPPSSLTPQNLKNKEISSNPEKNSVKFANKFIKDRSYKNNDKKSNRRKRRQQRKILKKNAQAIANKGGIPSGNVGVWINNL